MRSFFDWFSEQAPAERPWLILGKGPSFSRRQEFDLSAYNVLTLNHVVRQQPARVAHMIDLDVAVDCGPALQDNADVVVLPWRPHVRNKVGRKDLAALLPETPVLEALDRQGRLLYYDLNTAPRRDAERPVVRATFFSAEAALHLLALAGARTIRSLGVDGGASYGREFADLRDRTLLNNGHKSFDLQFRGFARTIMSTGTDFAPLDVEAPVRVYVGSTEAQMLSVKVLEYSIRKHASMSVQVFPLHEGTTPFSLPKDPANRPRTPFSFQRFFIPKLAGFRGRAIYVDSDMQVFKDIRGLWTLPFNGADLLAAREPGDTSRKPQFSVMLLDCAALRWELDDIVERLDRGELTYETLMYQMAVARNVRADIDPEWNSLERYEEGKTALLHYTDMNTQPWVSRENRLGYLWVRDLIEAVDAKFISMDYLREHIARGYARPSLGYQVEHRIEDAALLPKTARALDAGFVAPYKQIPDHRGGAGALRVLRAALRQAMQRSGLDRVQRRLQRTLAG